MNEETQEVLVEVRDLKKHFPVRRGLFRRQIGSIKAVDGVSFDVYRGEILGLVGESGGGKSTTGWTIIRDHEPTAGTVRFQGQDLATLTHGEMRKMRRHIQMIFQDPYASLNPRMTVGSIVSEPLVFTTSAHITRGGRASRSCWRLSASTLVSSIVIRMSFQEVSASG